MSVTFVYTPRGYVRLDTIERAAFVRDSATTQLIAADGKVIDDGHANFGEVIVSIVACSTEYECLTIVEADEEHPREVCAEPVLAWGLTALGHLVPITPSSREGVKERFALRKVGSEATYCDYSVSGWPDAKAWLESTKP